MEREEATLFIPYSILKNEHISSYALMTYCYLQKLTTTTGDNIHYISTYSIASYLTNEVDHSRKFLENIRHAIYDLLEINIISISKEITQSNGHYAIDCSKLWINTEKEQFVIVYYDEILRIIRSEVSNKQSVLRYYVGLIGTLSYKTTVHHPSLPNKNRVVGYCTLESLSQQLNLSEHLIVSYNKALQDIGLLYIYKHPGYVINDTKGIHTLPNIYGRYEDREYIDFFGKQYFECFDTRIHSSKSKDELNHKRRLAQRYQQLLKGSGKNYSKKEILEIYSYVTEENQKYAAIYFDNQECIWAFEKIRNVDIFESYDYIDTSESQKLVDKVYGIDDYDDVDDVDDDNDEI